jgi:fluoride ion exporter CrcB/FEX
VFTVFVNVVVIQLASSFLTIPGNSNNSLVAILVAIGLFATLLKTPSLMMEMVLYVSKNQTLKNVGRQVVNMVGSGAKTIMAKAKGATKIAGKVIEA